MAHIDHHRLEHFLAAVETGSILHAAQRVHLSQPALSRSIRELENAVGATLLERHPRGVRPTAYGETLARHARLLRNQSRLALSEIEALKDGTAGHLQVGVAPSFYRLLPAAVADLARTHPELTFDIVDGTYDTLAAGVLAGDLDAAFTMFPDGEADDDLLQRPLIESQFVLVMSSEHPLSSKRKVVFSDLAETSWVMVSRPTSLIDRVREAFLDSGIDPPAHCIRTDCIPVVKELLRSGSFIGVLPREVVHDEVRAGNLVAKPVPPNAAGMTAGVLTRRASVLPAILDLLVEAVGQERKRLRLPEPGRRSSR